MKIADGRWKALIVGGFLVLAEAAGLDDPEFSADFAFGQCAEEGSHRVKQIGVRRFGRET